MVGRLTPMLLAVFVLLSKPAFADGPSEKLVHVTLASDESTSPPQILSGRVVLTSQDGGVLLEERNGTLHNLTPPRFSNIETSKEEFRYLTIDELSAQLIERFSSAFGIHQSPHFVICSAGSDAFTEHCGQLLEKVYSEFFEFFDESGVTIHNPDAPLVVVIFGQAAQLRHYAAQQHPETKFEDVPGYYTTRYNQMYVSDVASGAPAIVVTC